jgi:CheY-like chemotaxis protein
LVLNETAVDVRELVAQVVSMVAETARTKGLQLLTRFECQPPPLLGDLTRLTQALLNLVSNAVKFTRTGSVTVTVAELGDSADEVRIRFEVSDTGIGIEPQVLQRLFTAFEQADATIVRNFGGNGLGLAITKRLAVLMDGDAGASSVPGQGSSFWFSATLRRQTDRTVTATAAPAAPAANAGDQLRQHWAGTRILVAEDNDTNRVVAQAILERVGLVCEVAEDGIQAVKKIQDSPLAHFGLILMDMQMPGLDGIAASRAIRALSVGVDLPIVALTANAFNDDKALCLAAGMNDFISKPVEPERLYAVVLQWLSRENGRTT